MRNVILSAFTAVLAGMAATPTPAKEPVYDYETYRNCGLMAVFLSADKSATPVQDKAYRKQAIALNRKALKLSMKQGLTLQQAVTKVESEAPALALVLKNNPAEAQALKADCIAKKLIQEYP